MRTDLIESGDVAGASCLEGLLFSAISSAELIAAMERNDGEAVEFHASALQRQLVAAPPIEFEIAERPRKPFN